MIPYVKIPDAIFEAVEIGEITKAQFEILFLCYRWANRAAGYRVDSYSAERVCRALGLDATRANLKRFQRGMADLVSRHIIHRDYQRGRERTYHAWVPLPERFERIGTAEENRVSLWKSDVVVPVAVPVVDENAPSNVAPEAYEQAESASVVDPVVENALLMSFNNQKPAETPPQAERETSKSPFQGDLPPFIPRGGDAQAAGHSKAPQDRAKNGKPALDSKQCEELDVIVGQFRALWMQYHNAFDPDPRALFDLLKQCSPIEVLHAYAKYGGDRASNTRIARFFATSAANAVRQARHSGEPIIFEGKTSDDCELSAFYALDDRWCELFRHPALLVFLNLFDELHFYHPKLGAFLKPWKAAVSAEGQRRKAEAQREPPKLKAKEERRKGEAEEQPISEEYQQNIATVLTTLTTKTTEVATKTKRHDVAQQLSERLRNWDFNDADTWCRYGGSVRLSDDGSQVVITHSTGKTETYGIDDIDTAVWRAEGID